MLADMQFRDKEQRNLTTQYYSARKIVIPTLFFQQSFRTLMRNLNPFFVFRAAYRITKPRLTSRRMARGGRCDIRLSQIIMQIKYNKNETFSLVKCRLIRRCRMGR